MKNTINLLAGIVISNCLYANLAIADVAITPNPEQSGQSLFMRQSASWQNIAGFEFCCGGYDTFQEHDFTHATGDFLKLNGGQWASGIPGAVGERAFASFGEGFDNDYDTSAEFLGWPATGTMRSPEFVISQPYINFKVGGGSNQFNHVYATSVVLVVNGEWVRHASGEDTEVLNWQSWDVTDYQNQTAYVLFIDLHPADGSDNQLPFLIADEFRADSLAAVETSVANYVDPAYAGVPLFNQDTALDLSGFEFCCSGYDTYQAHGFTNATGDFIKLDGGFWASTISGAVGERVFSSYGDGYQDESDPVAVQLGGKATGTLDSPEFIISKNFINFLIGGGANRFDAANATSVVLLVDEQVVRHASGKNQKNQLNWASWDVSEFVGQNARLRFIDQHPDDNSDASIAYLLADQFRAADSAVIAPGPQSQVDLTSAELTSSPADSGIPAFNRLNVPEQNIAGFEFCCAKFDSMHEHGFLAYGDFVRFDGGYWAGGLGNAVGDRVFASYGQGFANDADTSGSWYGAEATGTLVSPEFVITKPYINFLVGGGINGFESDNATAVVLRVNGKVVRQATGDNIEAELSWKSWDVTGLSGQKAVIEIMDLHDNSTDDGSVATILVDEIRQSDKAATQAVSASIVSQTDGHNVALKLNMGDANPYYENGEYYLYYLQNSGYHDWNLSKTSDLVNASFPQQVLAASGDTTQQDEWTGSGSVIKDQNGQYHLFYTGHNKNHYPVEAVMHAVASDNTLKNWHTIDADTFTGSNGYSDYDFRDPFVFWNQDAQQYWMLITSRYNNQAAIGLYTSNDLSNWTAQAPLYSESSPLNLEVPEYLKLAQIPFIIYSDQRPESPVVKYLVKQNDSWIKPDIDALDGRYFYAARSAGDENERLLFGWVPHTVGRSDNETPVWGGDLMIHQLHTLASGELAVKFPDKLRQQLSQTLARLDSQSQLINAAVSSKAKGKAWAKTKANSNNRIPSESEALTSLNPNEQLMLNAESSMNLLSVATQGDKAEAEFAIVFEDNTLRGRYLLILDSLNNQAKFVYEAADIQTLLADIKVNLSVDSGISLELFMHPENGVGSLYINQDKALSFRLYDLANYQVGIEALKHNLDILSLTRQAR